MKALWRFMFCRKHHHAYTRFKYDGWQLGSCHWCGAAPPAGPEAELREDLAKAEERIDSLNIALRQERAKRRATRNEKDPSEKT